MVEVVPRGGVPLVDFSPIGNLGNIYREAQQRAMRERVLAGANLDAPDWQDRVARSLLQGGDFEGGLSLAKLSSDQANRAFMQRLAMMRLDDPPDQLKVLKAAGIDPASPEGRKALFPRTDTPISATDKKAIMSAEDDVPRLQQTIDNVTRAKELNKMVYEGAGASMRGRAGATLPDWLVPDWVAKPPSGDPAKPSASDATVEWDQLMGQEAIQLMSETLKGASTDFEMRKFLGIAADTSLPSTARENAMNRFLALANRELSLRRQRAQELRSGSYFKEGGGTSGGPKKGDVVDGFEFLGGNPKDRASWRPVQ